MNPVGIVDTGPTVAFLNRREQHHAWAVEQFRRFPVLHTCEAVITEACFLVKAAAPVVQLLRNGTLRISYTANGEEEHIGYLVEQYADRPMSFADACIVRMSEQYEDCEVITQDSDFLFYRRHGSEAIPATFP